MKSESFKEPIDLIKHDGAVLLESLLLSAFEKEATDIHLDGLENGLRVRFRIHGRLIDQSMFTREEGDLVLRRIKVFGGMDPRRFGCIQDGSASMQIDHTIRDIRFAITVGSGHRECAAIRLFQPHLQSLENLSFPPREKSEIEWWIQHGTGLLLISGPTGCGKTSTLYSILHRLSESPYAVVTLENPVERRLKGIRQIDVEGMGRPTFAEGLRSVMRQDPDVLMIGEIRDLESAKTAIDAALSGHRVLASIHAPCALSVKERLRSSFGIDEYSLETALEISLSQRLIPLLCMECRFLTDHHPKGFSNDIPLYESRGCPACGGMGRSGRKLLVEMVRSTRFLETREHSTKYFFQENETAFESIQSQAYQLLQRGVIAYSDYPF